MEFFFEPLVSDEADVRVLAVAEVDDGREFLEVLRVDSHRDVHEAVLFEVLHVLAEVVLHENVFPFGLVADELLDRLRDHLLGRELGFSGLGELHSAEVLPAEDLSPRGRGLGGGAQGSELD